jgi:hypothetical protein
MARVLSCRDGLFSHGEGAESVTLLFVARVVVAVLRAERRSGVHGSGMCLGKHD